MIYIFVSACAALCKQYQVIIGCAKMKPYLNTLRLRQNGRHFTHDIFKCIFLNEDIWIPIKISLKFVPQGPINTIPALVQIMDWRRPGDKPLSGPMMVRLPTHICVTWPHWVNTLVPGISGWNFENAIFSLVFLIGIFKSPYDYVLAWMPLVVNDDNSILVQVMAWHHQATSH